MGKSKHATSKHCSLDNMQEEEGHLQMGASECEGRGGLWGNPTRWTPGMEQIQREWRKLPGAPRLGKEPLSPN